MCGSSATDPYSFFVPNGSVGNGLSFDHGTAKRISGAICWYVCVRGQTGRSSNAVHSWQINTPCLAGWHGYYNTSTPIDKAPVQYVDAGNAGPATHNGGIPYGCD
jgi:hypothetical protein